MATNTKTPPKTQALDLRVDLNANCSAVVREEIAVRAVHEHYTQENVAQAIGMEYTAFTKAMKGHRRWSVDEMGRLARLFDLTLDELTATPKGLTRNRCFLSSVQVSDSERAAHEAHHTGRGEASTAAA